MLTAVSIRTLISDVRNGLCRQMPGSKSQFYHLLPFRQVPFIYSSVSLVIKMGEYSYLIGLNKSMHICQMLGIGLHSYEILKKKKGRWCH